MRIAIVSSLLISVLIIIATASLVPLYISSSYKLNDILKQIESRKKEITINGKQDPIKIIQNVNKKLAIIKKKDSVLPLSSDLIALIVEHKPDNIKINAIFYDREFGGGGVSLNGVARNRETMLSFLKSLEKEKVFIKVDLPISSFAEEEDIKFSIKITMEVKNKKNDKK